MSANTLSFGDGSAKKVNKAKKGGKQKNNDPNQPVMKLPFGIAQEPLPAGHFILCFASAIRFVQYYNSEEQQLQRIQM